MSTFDWAEFLNLAERLTARDSDEAALRTAISRAYYAVYHRASVYVRRNGLVEPGSRLSHRTVWEAFAVGRQPRRLEVSTCGDALKRIRELADYRNPFPGDLPTLTHDTVLEARELVDLIEGL